MAVLIITSDAPMTVAPETDVQSAILSHLLALEAQLATIISGSVVTPEQGAAIMQHMQDLKTKLGKFAQ